MKKFRGQKRYYKRLSNNNLEQYFNNLDFNSWFDFWHNHPDWDGYGNISWKHRKQHLRALIRQFDFLTDKFLIRKEPFQVFYIISINDSGEDSVYIHTENPNQENFPIKIENYNGDQKISSQIRLFIESLDYEWFYHKWDRESEIVKLIYIYDKNIGISIKNE